MYTSGKSYTKLMAISCNMDLLTSDGMLLHILSASESMDNFPMCVLGHIFSDGIGSIMVDSVVSAV